MKIAAVLIIALLIMAPNIMLGNSLGNRNSCCLDELDQFQTTVNQGVGVGNGIVPGFPRYNWSVAQSFIPTRNILTRVILLLATNGLPQTVYPFVVAIRNELDGENLAVAKKESQSMYAYPELIWVEFDFDDIVVVPGESYYIVAYTANVTDNAYVWGINTEGGYSKGEMYVSWNDGATWRTDFITVDTCFMTYGRNDSAPTAPYITGPSSGKAGEEYEYKFVAEDAEGDDIYYFVEWGDGNSSGWLGPYPSDEQISLKHTWKERGTYLIRAKAKDAYGIEGEWGTLEISIPKSHIIYILVQRLGWLGWLFYISKIFIS